MKKLIIGTIGAFFVFLLTCFLLGYLGFRPGEIVVSKWILVSFNIALGTLPALIHCISIGDVVSVAFWSPPLAILAISVWFYVRDDNYVLLLIGLEIWAFAGLLRVVAESI